MDVKLAYYTKVTLHSGNPIEFFTALQGVADRLGVPMSWLADCIYLESEFNPKAKASTSTASGLMQLIEANCQFFARTSAENYRKLSNVKQLPGIESYLKAQIKSFGKPKDWFDLYCLVFYPVWTGKSDNALLDSGAYSSNKSIDVNKDGHITKGEFRQVVTKRLPGGAAATIKKLLPSQAS